MKIYKCCGSESITKKYFCAECGSSEFEEKEISDRGTVYSYTKIHVPPAEFAALAPYNVVLVDLDESTAKITTRIKEDVAIGDAVTLKQIDQGAYVYEKIPQ
ncbi:Zn-ribbon domain-containing OB-fold protein [Planococcus lenghuensis]|uniref:Nucleic acid-binding protein n=1 Tax=Planococcus lenghuensis TaxID=2213202 RepID=A0A1Q2L4B0_9BACL|nr:OB-fold domain-containing protein [Planococcus lenghuensis]AQQ54692.1 nucleic acid-binding protein [Planococcus lenghuensis]